MASLSHECPGCRTGKIALRIVASEQDPRATNVVEEKYTRRGFIWWICPNQECETAGAAYVCHDRGFSYNHFEGNTDITGQYEMLKFWPEIRDPEIPQHLPPEIESALRQGEDNFPRLQNREASGMMYRRALEMALKHIDPEAGGTLAARITAAADKGLLTRDIANWAHEIRILGNEAGHEVDGIERTDLIALRGITNSALQYLFTLPGMVRELRGQTTQETKE